MAYKYSATKALLCYSAFEVAYLTSQLCPFTVFLICFVIYLLKQESPNFFRNVIDSYRGGPCWLWMSTFIVGGCLPEFPTWDLVLCWPSPLNEPRIQLRILSVQVAVVAYQRNIKHAAMIVIIILHWPGLLRDTLVQLTPALALALGLVGGRLPGLAKLRDSLSVDMKEFVFREANRLSMILCGVSCLFILLDPDGWTISLNLLLGLGVTGAMLVIHSSNLIDDEKEEGSAMSQEARRELSIFGVVCFHVGVIGLTMHYVRLHLLVIAIPTGSK